LGIATLIVGGAVGYSITENNRTEADALKDKPAVVQNESKPVPAELQKILDGVKAHEFWYERGISEEEVDQALDDKK